MADRYQPPEQGRALQVFDIAFLLVAIFGTLLLPVALKLAGAATETTKIENPTWEALKQTPAQVAQWQALGKDPASAHDIIQTRFNYTFDWPTLIGVGVVLFLYFLLLFRLSESEYREVISEKFGDRK